MKKSKEMQSKAINSLHFIDGQYVPSISERTFENISPVTEDVIATIAEGGKEEVDLAVAAAKRALNGPWKEFTLAQRSKLLRRIGDILLERNDELAVLESLDTGKPYWISKNIDIPRSANNFQFFADYMMSLTTEAIVTDNVAVNYGVRRPVGVVGIISPWNFPLLLMTWKLAPALAMGNTVVIKQSELTPMTATVLAQICKDAGVPDGVVNVVHGFGADSVGSALTEHPDVNAIAFTGETTTGKAIMRAAAGNLKRLSFELGGKNPNIVFASANFDEVIDTSIRSSFLNQGQLCQCASRIYVERSRYEEFVERFVELSKTQTVGDPFDDATKIGALIGKEHYDRVNSYLELAKQDGGKFVLGGNRPEGIEGGYFIEPTIITNLPDQCRVQQEEVFGPVVAITPFDSEDEVIAAANGTPYGLSASVWSNDIKQAHRVAQQIEAGTVWVNSWFVRDFRASQGGQKQSGIGYEGGIRSLDFYSELSNICVKL